MTTRRWWAVVFFAAALAVVLTWSHWLAHMIGRERQQAHDAVLLGWVASRFMDRDFDPLEWRDFGCVLPNQTSTSSPTPVSLSSPL